MAGIDGVNTVIKWLAEKKLVPEETLGDVLLRMCKRQETPTSMVVAQLLDNHLDGAGDLFGCTIRKEIVEKIVGATLLIDRGNL